MIGHCGVVASQRRWVSSGGSSTTPARPRSMRRRPSSTKMRDQTISPGLLMPLSVPPPRRKYIGGLGPAMGAGPPVVKRGGGGGAGAGQDKEQMVARAPD